MQTSISLLMHTMPMPAIYPLFFVEGDNNDNGAAMLSSSDGDTDISNSSIDAPDERVDDTQAIDKLPEVVQDDNNDDYKTVPLLPVISPQFNSTDPYAVLGAPLNATMRQIVILL